MQALYPGTLDCVHCGLCLTSCPTYLETGRETSSPRGRVYLMRGVAEGRIPLAGTVAEEAYLCLGCRACETACPSGVRYGALLEQTRAAVEEAGLRTGFAKRAESLALRQLVPKPRRLHALIAGLGLAQRLGLDRLVRPLLPRRLRDMHALLPQVPPARERQRLPGFTPALGERRGRVALFEGCIMPELFGAVNAATLRVLSRNGFEVVVPETQGCCGALQAHAGEEATAARLAEANLAAFQQDEMDGVDAVILNSAGCGAALRELPDRLGPEAAALASSVRDICEFLDEVGLRAPLGPVPGTLCYDDPCHLLHGQGVGAAPRRLLGLVPELELRAHEDPGGCCGAAGIYNLTQPEMSRAVLGRKLDALAAADPDIVATGNPGCIMQLRSGVRERGLRMRVAHPIEILDEAGASAGHGAPAGRGVSAAGQR